ncbi:helix-turn-helix domain-containing protein [Streptomyces sp. RLB1-33]|nr:helix-turn-helix domain-containing protein [Streptomyces sp. RLB1-33]QIY73745.1 helix-turn-helix domain-containing protein [Streptomyces sp. RLB1-33]
MHDEQNDQNRALAELRKLLGARMARARLNQTDLAGLSGLGRTTVSEALSAKKPVPSAQTVTAMARALKLPVQELQALQRTAAETSGTIPTGGPGRPIGEWEPHALEVHPAGPGRAASGSGTPAVRALSGYVPREHDVVLADAVRDAAAGHSRIVVLVGTSSTGKTRACWEAVQPLADRGWRLWHPFDPTRAGAALEDLHQVRPRTVVWLNEAQHYLGDRAAGERIAAAVHHLLVTPERGPVLVLGTLWPEYAHQYMAVPTPGGEDPHSRVRELLAGRTLTVPDAFDAPALASATVLAEGGDRLLGDALTRASTDGRVAQDLAGAPELLDRYEHASPAAKAVLEAAMDARRLGVGLHLPQTFLTDAATDYLGQSDYDQLTDDWAERAYAELAELVHGKQAPLRRTIPRPPRRPPIPTATVAAEVPPPTAGPQFRLADYLEQHGRTSRRHLCPPASFWHAAHARLTHPDDLNSLALAAEGRWRLQWAHYLRHRAANHGNTDALYHLAELREVAGDLEGAEALARRAAMFGSTKTLYRLAVLRAKTEGWQGPEPLLREAADHGNTDALYRVAELREQAGDRQGAESLLREAADRGDIHALYRLAEMLAKAGDQQDAETLLREAADHGDTHALCRLAEQREEAGDRQGAEDLARQAAHCGNTNALYRLAELRVEAGDLEDAADLARMATGEFRLRLLCRLAEVREDAGDPEGAEALLRTAVGYGDANALYLLVQLRERAGDREGAEDVVRQAIDYGDTNLLNRLAQSRERAGDREGAEILARQVANHGDSRALHHLAVMREQAGDREGAEALLWEAVNHGDSGALSRLAELREKAGDLEDAEDLARQVAHHGNTIPLYRLAEQRKKAGDRRGAEDLARQAANIGDTSPLRSLTVMRNVLTSLWPSGLDADGTPTAQWEP